jgi:hypothetical protein
LGEDLAVQPAILAPTAVGRSDQNDREPVAFLRRVAVGEQLDAVGHRHPEIALDAELPAQRLLELRRTSDRPAEKAQGNPPS